MAKSCAVELYRKKISFELQKKNTKQKQIPLNFPQNVTVYCYNWHTECNIHAKILHGSLSKFLGKKMFDARFVSVVRDLTLRFHVQYFACATVNRNIFRCISWVYYAHAVLKPSRLSLRTVPPNTVKTIGKNTADVSKGY